MKERVPSNLEAQATRLPELPPLRDLKERLSRNRQEASALKRLIRIASDLGLPSKESEVSYHG